MVERCVMTEKPAISVCNITKTYKLYENRIDRVKEAFHPLRKAYSQPFHALHKVSFNVERGETMGIIGRNGSGKSTLLQIVCGILQPSSGGLAVNGRITALLELGAGFNPEFTGIENIYLNGSILGLSKQEIDDKLDDILAFADIGDFVRQPVKTYSSGMAVRLAFAVQANIDPDIFVVDEALAVGDAYFVHRCMLRFHEMQKQGKTILFVTHDSSSVKKLCHRALWLDQGEMRMIGGAVDVVDHYVADLFKQKEVEQSELLQAVDEGSVKANSQAKALPLETQLPNVDKRFGDQQLSILGAGFYSANMEPMGSCEQEADVILRVSIRNNSMFAPHPLSIGYIVRDRQGVEIASTHTMAEGVALPAIAVGETLTVRLKITIPMLYPGNYSFTPSLSRYVDNEHVICDRVYNALILEITSSKEMHVLLRFKTDVEVEGQAA